MKDFIQGNKQFLKRENIRTILLFEVFFKLLLLAVMAPLVTWGIQWSLQFAGVTYLTNESFYRMLKSPQTWVWAGVMILFFYSLWNV